MNKIYKYASFDVKDMDISKREVAFYFNALGHYDSDNDRMIPGSSSKTVQENFPRIKHLYNHWNTVGKPLSIEEDSFGAFMVSKIGRDSDSHNVLLKYEDGLITEHSFGLEPILEKSKKNEKGGLDIYEYKMWEASSLDKWGAQSMTPVISVKSMEKNNIQEWVVRLEKLTKAIKKGYTDEQIQEFEYQMKSIVEFLKQIQTTQPERIDETTEPETVKGIDYNKLIQLFN